MLCVVIKGPTIEMAMQQLSEAKAARADLVELRFDCFEALDLDAITKLRQSHPIPMIFTLRSGSQGGNFKGSQELQLATISRLASLKPEYLDVESVLPTSFIANISTQYPTIKLILSHHEFEPSATSFEAIYQEMNHIPAFYYKIAMTVEISSAALQLLLWKKTRNDKVIAIGMGPQGQVSRILGPVFHTPITYASIDQNPKCALGQLSASLLTELYRFHSLNPNCALYGLIGDPIEASIGDVTHNALFHKCGLNAVYVKLQVKETELKHFLHLAKQIPFQGLSVTMPLKEKIIPFLDDLDPHARAIGAVNTLQLKEGKYHGSNTDGFGALNAIEKHLLVKGKRIVIIGAGGAAKAIAYEACRREARVTILNRHIEKAHYIASKLSCDVVAMGQPLEYDIIINTTPSTMPIEADQLLPNTFSMDIKTTPKETEFLKMAQDKGCSLIYGYEMFVEQALGQYHTWFNKDDLDFELCRKVLYQSAQSIL